MQKLIVGGGWPRRLFTRRAILSAALGVAAASAMPMAARAATVDAKLVRQAELDYGALPDEPYPIPAIDIAKLSPEYYRRIVEDPTGERSGTVVVDTQDRVLYLTLGAKKALRYGIGVGRAGFVWSGRGEIRYKKPWPTWTPPAEMIVRQPELEQYRTGMPPGLENPLGARALYIFHDGADTLYRVHGNNDVSSIGQAVSSGCVRLLQQDVIDLYTRVIVPAPIVVT
jgi:lipoprotein-anchoring transpeptidase ErfK/SrfK